MDHSRDTLRQRISDELLPRVRGPAQYIGGEVNSLARDWDAAELRVALLFPETYAMGTSNLGHSILYWIANHTPGVACERVYSPWLDAEQVMRDRGIPLFTWESRRPAAEADLLAVSLQYEMTYSNVLNALDLAGLPVRSADRDERHPLVVAGGPQADNPEPLAEFVDLFVIGDGEHAIEAILAEMRAGKRAGASRRELLLALARRYDWAYVPAFFDVRYHDDGTVAAVEANQAGIHEKIRRCRTPDFETVAFPTRQLIPWTRSVHERATVEIMRGCPQRCRFCHAGHSKFPLVWRSADRVVELAEQAYRSTGFDEIALTSLSTSDYPQLGELMERLNARFGPRRVSVSVPSLRVDKQLQHIPWQVQQVRKSGLTIAAEAACEPMRQVIGKKVADVDLLDGVRAAFQAGWRSVKLYFMVGFPGESDADVRGIVELAKQVAWERKKLHGQPASVNASVSPLVPKPHTPFQWIGQRDGDYFARCRDSLKAAAMRSPVHVSFHRIDRSLLEGVIARGDRRMGRAIENAWRDGARFDGWDECFDYDRWMRAFAAAGLDPAFYSQRERAIEETLPWDHIESGAGRSLLERQARDCYRLLAERAADSDQP